MGRVTGTLHALPLGSLGDLEPSWESFIADGPTRCMERQRKFDLDDDWLNQIEGFLAEVERPTRSSVLLHTELMLDHFFAERTSRGWELTGLIDFEPAMVGNPEYEFASVGLFVAGGERDALRAFLLAYEYRPEELDGEFSRR